MAGDNRVVYSYDLMNTSLLYRVNPEDCNKFYPQINEQRIVLEIWFNDNLRRFIPLKTFNFNMNIVEWESLSNSHKYSNRLF